MLSRTPVYERTFRNCLWLGQHNHTLYVVIASALNMSEFVLTFSFYLNNGKAVHPLVYHIYKKNAGTRWYKMDLQQLRKVL